MNQKIHDAFATVTASEEIKNKTKNALQAQREKQHSTFFSSLMGKRILVTCCMVLMFVCIGGYYGMTRTAVSYISIDVNPSIELVLNRLDQVIQANAYNDDGSMILQEVSVNGMNYTKAVDTIVESQTMKTYLTDTSVLTFTVASNDEQKEALLQEGIQNCESSKNHNGQCYEADSTILEEAHDCGLSFGKYSAYLVLSQYDSTVTTEECKDMTMREIRDLIEEHDGESEHLGQGNQNGQGNGNHHGNGQHHSE